MATLITKPLLMRSGTDVAFSNQSDHKNSVYVEDLFLTTYFATMMKHIINKHNKDRIYLLAS